MESVNVLVFYGVKYSRALCTTRLSTLFLVDFICFLLLYSCAVIGFTKIKPCPPPPAPSILSYARPLSLPSSRFAPHPQSYILLINISFIFLFYFCLSRFCIWSDLEVCLMPGDLLRDVPMIRGIWKCLSKQGRK